MSLKQKVGLVFTLLIIVLVWIDLEHKTLYSMIVMLAVIINYIVHTTYYKIKMRP